MSAIIVHARGNKSQAIIRSLGRKGIHVVSTDSSRFAAGFFSRYSKSCITTPSPVLHPEEFLHVIEQRVKNGDLDVLIPSNSVETLLISRYKHRFEPYIKVPFASYQKMEQLHNKEKLSILAAELGIPIPQTFTPANYDEIKKIAETVNYPIVIKPKESSSSKGVFYAQSRNECLNIFKNLYDSSPAADTGMPLIQEYIPGEGYGVSVLFNNGDPRALFTHRRLREYPISGGPSTLRESVHHAQMERIATDLMKACEWHGVAMVEFKLHAATKKPYLIEVNPRFWGSISHAIASGVDFPYLLYTMAMDGDIRPVMDYKIGVKTRFLLNDIRSLYSIFRREKDIPFFIKELLADYPNDELHWEDPCPFFMYFGQKFTNALMRKRDDDE
ncbi:MAG: carbamoyl phosphate synthase-like protein [Methanoregula sp. PtaU1.Bin006]|uniref:carboxylate--amine ligase n=1 Tax=Methanoregula sp. PtaU1.Bin006 TaxID=1811681 RepID=UPI0009CBFBF0|nr:ATP-grasp domain-containing protein [Methanoregula sp. PtaU1.Bin006]OPY37233.1 MAG: carbamoyl phosphate synthase-like protein [Methanoregula sp. PtaU1.Bin006]